jgi:hypothetical protein
MIGGELVLKIAEGQNFVDVKGKEKFCLSYDMPKYANDGKLMRSTPYE